MIFLLIILILGAAVFGVILIPLTIIKIAKDTCYNFEDLNVPKTDFGVKPWESEEEVLPPCSDDDFFAEEDDEDPADPEVCSDIPFEELKKLKELLDMEIITPEEFEAKKKQLLGL